MAGVQEYDPSDLLQHKFEFNNTTSLSTNMPNNIIKNIIYQPDNR